MAFRPLETPRLVLRPLVIADAEAVHGYRSDPEVARFQSWESTSLADTEEMIRTRIASEPDLPGTWFQLALCRRADHLLVGDCGIHFLPEEPRHVEIGITLASPHQGQGYATEALSAVFGYVFGQLGKHRIQASVDPENQASIRLLEKMGMRREAHFVEGLWFKGRWADDLVYAVLNREWQSR
jgi:RimJ/RimL family protein N-acetyltransferase